MDIRYLLGTNNCTPLSHKAKSYIWLEEKYQRINELFIGYMMNPNLSMNKAFKKQVKVCMETTFSTKTMTHISKILFKPDKRVLALIMFLRIEKKMQRKCSEC